MCGLCLCQYDENEDGGESDEESEYPSEDQEEARDIRFRLKLSRGEICVANLKAPVFSRP